jgi:hypothetical protein
VQRLSRQSIVQAFEALAARLPVDQDCVVVVTGGAAIVLLYEARESTKDVDVVAVTPESGQALRAAALDVASMLGLPPDWLNDGAKGYAHGLALGKELLRSGRLTVRALAVEQLLAMKLSAWRDDVDIADARLLLSKIEGGREDVWARVEPYVVPGRQLKAQYAFLDLWEDRHGSA